MKSGEGKMTYPTGNYFEGEWRENKRNGEGTMHWKTTNEKYTGHWEDNFQSGFGTHVWLEGGGDNKLLRNRYVGYWKKGLRHGQGTFYYSNGSKYEGEWKDNLKHGQGVFTFEDGTSYNGPFDNDRMVNRAVAGVALIKQDGADADKESQNEGVTGGATTKNSRQLSKPSGGGASPSKQASQTKGTITAQAMSTSNPQLTQQNKFLASNRAKREVEQNPFKTLIDIADLIEFESNPAEVEKEVQNILLRNNSDMK